MWYNTARFFNDEGRFTQVDPLWQKYPSISPYVRVGDNPLIIVDNSGDTTTIIQQRTSEDTENDVTLSTITVTSTETEISFSGGVLEPGPNGPNTRTATGTYAGAQQTNSGSGEPYEDGPRITIVNAVDENGNVLDEGHQYHVGNIRDQTTGCPLPGTSSGINSVKHSQDSMDAINRIVNTDGSGIILIKIYNMQPLQ